MPVWIFALYALATARLTGLVTHDEITRPARERLVGAFNPHRRAHRWIAYALGATGETSTGCPWCISVWVAALTAPIVAATAHSRVTQTVLAGLAASQVVGMIHNLGRE